MSRHDALDMVRLVQEDHGGVPLALGKGRDDGRRIIPPMAFRDDGADSAFLADACMHTEGLESNSNNES